MVSVFRAFSEYNPQMFGQTRESAPTRGDALQFGTKFLREKSPASQVQEQHAKEHEGQVEGFAAEVLLVEEPCPNEEADGH